MNKKIKKLKEPYYINIALFRVDVMLWVGPAKDFVMALEGNVAEEHMINIREHFKEHPIEDTTLGRLVEVSGGGSVIWMKEHARNTLNHECVHAATYIIRSRCMNVCSETDELLAYLVEYLISEFTKQMEKKI